MSERAAIASLRPTQLTVGLREADAKRRHWEGADAAGRERLLAAHVAPIVIGPKRRAYIVDHHHFARALADAGETHVLVAPIADLSALGRREFWLAMDHRRWMHPFDDDGRRRGRRELPRDVRGLIDDPYRSLAGAVREAGGFAKCDAPFAEFLWADFFRARIHARAVRRHFLRAADHAAALARTPAAAHLPGFTPHGDPA